MWSSVLAISALPINDGIDVGCTGINFNLFGFTEKGANLTIRS